MLKTDSPKIDFLLLESIKADLKASENHQTKSVKARSSEEENEFERACIDFDLEEQDFEVDSDVGKRGVQKKNLQENSLPLAKDKVLNQTFTIEKEGGKSKTVVEDLTELFYGDDEKLALEEPDQQKVYPSKDIHEGLKNWGVKRISIRQALGHQENNCIPFASNYTTLETLISPDYRLSRFLPFVDLRGHRFSNNTYAANLGVGGRYIPGPENKRIKELFGFNLYYDYRQGNIGYYNQIGAGIEALGERWDFRANAYVPFGKRRHINVCTFDGYIGDYSKTVKKIESISYSFNGELGCLAVRSEYFLLYVAAGPYFIARDKNSSIKIGGEARIRPQYKDLFALDLSGRYDEIFGTIWQVEVIFNIPLYEISDQNKRPIGASDRQIYQRVERFEVMPLQKKQCIYVNW